MRRFGSEPADARDTSVILEKSKGVSFASKAKQGAAPTADIYPRSKLPFEITIDFRSVSCDEYSDPKHVSMCLKVIFDEYLEKYLFLQSIRVVYYLRFDIKLTCFSRC